MRTARQLMYSSLAIVTLVSLTAAPAQAQGKSSKKPKHYSVSSDKAVTVSRTVLTEQGYHVVRVEKVGATQVIYFYRGNNGRGKGKGPLQHMVIRKVHDRVLFEEAEPSLMVDIDVRLKL